MPRVEYFDTKLNEWIIYSTPVNQDHAIIHFEVIKKRGDSVRIITEGKITHSFSKGEK
jgi:hypothetical protein